jgi:small-conductance mechanosensitive channel
MRDFRDELLAIVAHEWVWRALVAVVIAVAGIWLARWVARLLDRLMTRTHVEEILRSFLRNVAYAVVVIVVLVVALDFAGVPTTSLLAVIGAAGLGIGLALKDSLSNIASGVMLIVLRPFRAGDSVQIAGLEGVVESVRIFQTRMHTADNREIILPNSQITTSPIINYTARSDRRIDLPLALAFGDDIPSARAALLAIAAGQPRVKAMPAPEVIVSAVGESTVTVQLRAWVAAKDHPAVQAELFEAVLADFSHRGLRIPLPQREVHVFHHGPVDARVDPQEILKPSL